ncbi:hypothetical protein T01_1718 [Trichinella spiralis]|uniref:Uncharacterized protein n=1 Tax=Trichinella spiralis TaxID=6334 RepID=A0A0V1B7U4_TRISP|nr:hypothetical protein T01_1718 [Trichinella spiralis]
MEYDDNNNDDDDSDDVVQSTNQGCFTSWMGQNYLLLLFLARSATPVGSVPLSLATDLWVRIVEAESGFDLASTFSNPNLRNNREEEEEEEEGKKRERICLIWTAFDVTVRLFVASTSHLSSVTLIAQLERPHKLLEY